MLPRNPNVESIFLLSLIFKINFQNFRSRLSVSLKTAWRTSDQGTKNCAGTETAHSLWWEVGKPGDN